MSYGLIGEDYDVHNTDEALDSFKSIVEAVTSLEPIQINETVNAPLEEQWHFAVQVFMRSDMDKDSLRTIQLDFYDRYNPISLKVEDVDKSGTSNTTYKEFCLIDSNSVTAFEAVYLKRVCSLKRLQ